MLRILHFANIINRYDFIDNVLRHCDRTRFRLYACTFSAQSNIQPPAYTDVPHYVLGVRGRISYPSAVTKLSAILRREQIDIVHVHHFDPMVLGLVAAAGAGCPVVVGRHYSDAIWRLASPWKRAMYLRAEALCYRRAAMVVVPSTYVDDLLVRVQGVDRRKVVRIPYGFDMSKYAPSVDGPREVRRTFAPDGEVLVGSFGRLHPEKGQIFLIQAARALATVVPRLRVLLVGDGPDRARLQREVEGAGLRDRVVFAGWRTDVVDVLAAMDIVVQPSRSECFSQVMVEALALGRPLVMTDVSGARDVIVGGKTGLLIPSGDADAIASSLGMLLEAPEFARRLGEAGRMDVRARLDIRRVIRQYEDCYLTVHGSRSAA